MPTESPAAHKLKALRRRVAKLSVRAFAEQLGYERHTSYAYYEDDFKEEHLPMDLIRKVAAALVGRGEPPITEAEVMALAGVPAPIVLTQTEPLRSTSRIYPPTIAALPIDVPIYGVAVGGSVGDFQLNGQIIDYARRPPGISGNASAYCIWITGTSMEPKFKQGDLIYIDPHRPARTGDYVLVELKPQHGGEPGAAYVKMLVATTPTKLKLSQHNPSTDKIEVPRDKVLRVHRVMELNELLGA